MMRTGSVGSVIIHIAALFAIAARPASADHVDDIVKTAMETSKTPGVSIAVLRHGRVIKARGYGLADVEHKTPATEKTVYELGSITKQFTATAIMMLVEEGKLRLEDNVVDVLSDLPKAWNGITIRHLLTHTSRIFNYTSLPNFFAIAQKDVPTADVVKAVTDRPLDFQPGDQWSYSNTGYHLLGMVIEKVTGKRYGEFLQERIFAPLGMGSTRVNDLAGSIAGRAVGYTNKSGVPQKAQQISMTWPFSAGVLVSTVADVVKWDQAVEARKLLKTASWDQIWSPVKLNNGSTFPYGFGWQLADENGHRLIEHGGGIPGFSTDNAWYPEDQLTVVVLTNSDSANPGMLRKKIAQAYVPALTPRVTAIEDRDPTVTQLVRDVLRESADGTLKQDRFTAQMAAIIFPNRLKGAQAFFRDQGPLERLSLVSRKEEAAVKSYEYVAQYKAAAVRVSLSLNKEGKIAGLLLRPE